MRRLSTIFLVCFLAVLASLSGVVAWRVMARRTPATVQQPAPQAEYQIKEVHINETLDGNLRWSLNADQAEVYEKKGITVMRNVVIQLFSRDGDWTVTSDEGTLNNAPRDVALTGNVVIRASERARDADGQPGLAERAPDAPHGRRSGDPPGGNDDHRTGPLRSHEGGDGRPRPERPGRHHRPHEVEPRPLPEEPGRLRADAGHARPAGHEIVERADAAECLVVNTCAFIDRAREESVNTILDLARLKERGARGRSS